MSATGNTTPLMDDQSNGTIGTRNFDDYGAKQISVEVSRRNYRQGIKSDRELNEFRQIVYKMVSGWAMEDKIAQITEYGDISQLRKYKNPSEDQINKILTESIIIHLRPEDLRRLRLDMAQKENKVKRGIANANKNADHIRKKYRALNTASFGDAAIAVSGAKNEKQYAKARNNFDPSFTVPKFITRLYGKLRRELKEVLNDCFNKVELTGLAARMGIEIPTSGNQFKILTQSIINKTCLYVDLITGKSRVNYGNAIMDPEPYNTILQYTSFSYVTGTPGISPSEWAKKKVEARRAKRQIEERSKRYNVRSFKGNTDSMARVTNGTKAKSLKEMAMKLRHNDVGILKDASFEELVELAGRYGIDPTARRNKDINVLKAKIYNGMRNDFERVEKLRRQRSSMVSKGKGGRKLQEIDDNLSVYSDLKIKKEEGNSELVPVQFSSNGVLKTKVIKAAMPVYIVGQGTPGTRKEKAGEVKETTTSEQKAISDLFGTDIRIQSKSDLTEPELRALNYILTLDFTSSSTVVTDDIPRNLTDLITQIGAFDSTLIHKIVAGVCGEYEVTALPPERLTTLKLHLAYAWGMKKNYKNLCDYLTNKYRIKYSRGGKVGRFFKGVGKGLLEITGLAAAGRGLARIFKGFANVAKNIWGDKYPTSPDQLSEKARQIYYSLTEIKSPSLMISKIQDTGLGFDHGKLLGMRDIPEEELNSNAKLNIFKAIYANLLRETKLEKLYLFMSNLYKNGKWKNEAKGIGALYDEITSKKWYRKVYGAFKLTGKFFRDAFKTRITSENEKLMPGSLDTDTPPGETNIEGEEVANIPIIPKLLYKNGVIDTAQIKEVVPVFVTNDLIRNTDNIELTPGARASYSAGKGGTIERITDYKKMIGSDDKEKGISLTKTPEQILFEMTEAGYTPKSKFLDKSDPLFKSLKIGDKPSFHNDDIEWSLNNGFKFATGGYTYSDTFITGDARGNNIFAGGAKPELIQTFSKTPVLSKITPIKKFAGGGESLSDVITGKSALNSSMDAVKEKLADIQQRSNIANLITSLGGEVPDGIYTMRPRGLARIVRKTLKKYNKEIRSGKDINKGSASSKIASEAESIGIKTIDTTKPAMPVYIVNEFAAGSVMVDKLDKVATSITSNFNTLMTGLAVPMTIAAPYGAGTAMMPGFAGFSTANTIGTTVAMGIDTGAEIAQAALEGFNTGGKITRAYSGGKIPRFVTGGSAVKAITGDAAGKNIFANGAKPELVKSNGDLEVIPLNKGGEANNIKIDRMTPEERKDALATSIASHVVKFTYNLPDGVSEVSNVGEAIKVFDVKPGLTDIIDVNGESMSLVDMLSKIQTELAGILATSVTTTEVISTLATLMGSKNGNSGSSKSVETNPFAGPPPTSLNSILGGN